MAKRPAPETQDALLDLQAAVGNRAVAGMLRSVAPVIQRKKPPPQPPPPARTTPGWTGADPTPGKLLPGDKTTVDPKDLQGGWNASQVRVGAIWRVPVDGLSLGNKEAFADGEAAKTDEPATGRAIVLVHKDLNAKAPVTVLLHLHGYGFRAGDPYAGWRQQRTDTKTPDPKAGTVRDVSQDRIQAQIEATGNAQVVAILAQGAGRSRFGGLEQAPDDYVNQVLKRTADVATGTAIPLKTVPSDWRLVLSAHSGGGDRLATTLGMDASGALAKKGGRAIAEVVLFDAIHVIAEKKKDDVVVQKAWDGVAAVLGWVEHHVAKVARALKGTKDSALRDKAVADCPVLRAYGSSVYKGTYVRLGKELGQLLSRYASLLGDKKAAVEARFTVEILAGAGHETVVRGLGTDPPDGPLTNALLALNDPTRPSTVKGAVPTPAPPKTTVAPTVSRQPVPPGGDRGRPRAPAGNAAFTQATTAGTAEAREAVAEALRDSGHPDARTWYAGMVSDASFLGMQISASTGTVPGVHRRLLDRLDRAQTALLARQAYRGLTVEQVRQRLNMYSISGLRLPMPASGAERTPSLHCFGMAVDINYAGSPFVGLQQASRQEARFTSSRTPRVIERAMWLIHGRSFNVEAPLAAQTRGRRVGRAQGGVRCPRPVPEPVQRARGAGAGRPGGGGQAADGRGVEPALAPELVVQPRLVAGAHQDGLGGAGPLRLPGRRPSRQGGDHGLHGPPQGPGRGPGGGGPAVGRPVPRGQGHHALRPAGRHQPKRLRTGGDARPTGRRP